MNEIKKLLSYPLSMDDMIQYAPLGTRVITYKELINYDNIDDALGENGIMILLYLTVSNYSGHWCSVFKRNDNIIEFFDSYGSIIDYPLTYANSEIRNNNNETVPYLGFLILKSKYQIHYNDYQLQKHDRNISTCGRHVLVRLQYNNLSIDDYIKKIFINKLKSPDYIVSLKTYYIN